MENKDINYYIQELKSNDPTDYFYQYIHEENQPINLIKAIIILFKEGYLNKNNFSEKSRRNILEFHQENINQEDVLFLLNNEIIPLSKYNLKEELIEHIDNEIIFNSADKVLAWLLDNKINHYLLPNLLIKSDIHFRKLNEDQRSFIKETFSNNFFIDHHKELKNLYVLFIYDLSESELEKLIEESSLLEYLDHEEDVSIDFLKKHIKIQYPKNPTNFKIELEYIYENDPNWVQDLLKNLEFNSFFHYEFLDNNFSSYEDIFKETQKDVILEYYDRHEDTLSEDNLRLMLEYTEQIPLNIISNMNKRDYSNELIKICLFKLDKYFVYGVNRLDFSQINFADLVYSKILNKIQKEEYKIEDFNIEFENANIKELSTYINEDFYIKLIDGIENEEDFLILYNNIKSKKMIKKAIEFNLLTKPVDFILKTDFNLNEFVNDILETYTSLDLNQLQHLIRSSDEPFKIITRYDNINKKFILENIQLLNYNQIKYLVENKYLDFADIQNLNMIEINSYILKNIDSLEIDFSIEEFISNKIVNSNSISKLIDELNNQGKLKDNFNAILSVYHSEEYLKPIISNSLYFMDDKENYFDIILEMIPESYSLFFILEEFKEYASKYLSYKDLLNKEHIKKLSKKDLPIEYFIDKIEDLAPILKIQEDSKGIHIFLPNNAKLISYSIFRNKFNKTNYDFSDKDLTIFNFLVSEIIELPKRLKVSIESNLEYKVLNRDIDIEISNLEDMQKWFDFYEVSPLEVDVVRINKNYHIDFGIGKDKREQTIDFLKEVRKLDLSQLDNLIQDRSNFNLKRGYGIEAEFSLRCESQPEHYDDWSILSLDKLIEYIDNNYSFFEDEEYNKNEYLKIEKETKDSGLESLQQDFREYLYNNGLEEYNLNDDFDYLGENLEKTVLKYDKKRKATYTQDYFSSNGETWDLKTDSSVEDLDHGVLGIEIASPILYGKNDLNIFKRIMKDFTSFYYDVDIDRAGVHVHHDVSDFKEKFDNDMRLLRRELYPIQEMLFNVISPDRIDGPSADFCKKYNIQDLRYSFSDKDYSINFEPDETIEFRMKEGTTDIDDIANWVALTHDITDKIVNNLIRKSKKNIEKKKNIFDKIIIAAQAVSKRNIVNNDQIEDLMDMYNSAKEFQSKSERLI